MRKKKVDPAPSLLMILVRHLKGWFEKSELARILGVTPSQVTMWERRDRAVPIAILQRTFDKAEIPRGLIGPALRTIRAFVRAAQGRSRPDRAVGVAVAADTLPLLLSVVDLVLEPLSRSRRNRHLRPTADNRIEAEELWARLKRHSAADRRVLVEDGQDYQSWALCEKVAAESLAAAASDPREALSLAELAVHIAERIPGEAAWRRRVEGYAQAHLSFAHRAGNNLPAMSAALRRALQLWEEGASADPGLLDPAVVARIEAG